MSADKDVYMPYKLWWNKTKFWLFCCTKCSKNKNDLKPHIVESTRNDNSFRSTCSKCGHKLSFRYFDTCVLPIRRVMVNLHHRLTAVSLAIPKLLIVVEVYEKHIQVKSVYCAIMNMKYALTIKPHGQGGH